MSVYSAKSFDSSRRAASFGFVGMAGSGATVTNFYCAGDIYIYNVYTEKVGGFMKEKLSVSKFLFKLLRKILLCFFLLFALFAIITPVAFLDNDGRLMPNIVFGSKRVFYNVFECIIVILASNVVFISNLKNKRIVILTSIIDSLFFIKFVIYLVMYMIYADYLKTLFET
jgi:hypothetical protein